MSRIIPALILTLTAVTVGADERGALFAKPTPLAMGFSVDFGAICRDPSVSECADSPAILSYTAEDGVRHEFNVMLTTRGRGGKETSACTFPSLFIRFDPAQTQDTLFAGEPVLPFTTHCKHRSRAYHEYLIIEYLAFRLYHLVTENSLRVRLAKVDYLDSDSGREFTRYGFFTEHFEAMAERIHAALWQPEVFDPHHTDATDLAVLSVFQYMIGNLDWSVIHLHNIVLFRSPGQAVIAVPFDFDYSGLVEAEYAVPPEGFGLRSVRTRRYRGFCRAETDWGMVFDRFLAERAAAMALVAQLPVLGNVRRGRLQRYLDSFFRIAASEQKRERSIIAACRDLPAFD